jgi:hypothetical protein
LGYARPGSATIIVKALVKSEAKKGIPRRAARKDPAGVLPHSVRAIRC